MAKFFNVESDKLKLMNVLLDRKVDNEFIVLSEYKEICDICQYSAKYQNLHIVSVPRGHLDMNYRLG